MNLSDAARMLPDRAGIGRAEGDRDGLEPPPVVVLEHPDDLSAHRMVVIFGAQVGEPDALVAVFPARPGRCVRKHVTIEWI